MEDRWRCWSRMDQCRFFRHQSFTAATARAKRLLAVTCRTMFLPFRDRPQTWVRPRKSKLVPSVSGWRAPSVRLWAEVDEACLVGMEREPKPRKTLAQDRQDALGVDNIVERHDRIVSEPDKGALPVEARSHLGLEPFVQHVVQEDVREAG